MTQYENLDDESAARAEAVVVAGRVLNGTMFVGTAGVKNPGDHLAIIDVAEYIIGGLPDPDSSIAGVLGVLFGEDQRTDIGRGEYADSKQDNIVNPDAVIQAEAEIAEDIAYAPHGEDGLFTPTEFPQVDAHEKDKRPERLSDEDLRAAGVQVRVSLPRVQPAPTPVFDLPIGRAIKDHPQA